MTLLELMALPKVRTVPAAPRPLLIGCGGAKLPGVHRVDAIYTLGAWRIYRKALAERAAEGRSPLPYDVYVISAKYGIVPADRKIAWYDAVLMERPKKSNEVDPATLLPLLQRQALEYGLTEVDVSAGKLYAETLEAAGLTVHRLDPEQRGLGDQTKALRQHLLR